MIIDVSARKQATYVVLWYDVLCALFQNEAMTGTHTQNPIYSRITMALMEDTGWYLPNYDMADELKWGRDLGCDFALRQVSYLLMVQ